MSTTETTTTTPDATPTPRPKNPGGRPPHARQAFDKRLFEGYCAAGMTEVEVCSLFAMSERSLGREIKRHYGRVESFATVSPRLFVRTNVSLRRRVITAAMKDDPEGNPVDPAMLRFAADRFCGFATKTIVKKDPEQHADEMAVQQAALVPPPPSPEAQRVDALMAMLAKVVAKP